MLPRATGFTLIELLCCLAVISVLCAVSLPALGGLVPDGQSRSARNALIASLHFARSAASARAGEVVLCPSRDGQHCTGEPWWQHGWIVFADRDGNGRRDDDEPLLDVVQAQPGLAIASSAGRVHVSYRADGSAAGTNLTLTFCDRRGPRAAASVVVNNAGRPRQGTPTAAQAAAACAGLAGSGA
jgi:type IV fimbrial biogenesis protein FimT